MLTSMRAGQLPHRDTRRRAEFAAKRRRGHQRSGRPGRRARVLYGASVGRHGHVAVADVTTAPWSTCGVDDRFGFDAVQSDTRHTTPVYAHLASLRSSVSVACCSKFATVVLTVSLLPFFLLLLLYTTPLALSLRTAGEGERGGFAMVMRPEPRGPSSATNRPFPSRP
jgi:hypothetical protein